VLLIRPIPQNDGNVLPSTMRVNGGIGDFELNYGAKA
jgi:hypothetical protein